MVQSKGAGWGLAFGASRGSLLKKNGKKCRRKMRRMARGQEAVREMMASRGPTWESRQRRDAARAEEGDLIVGQARCFKISDRRKTGHLQVGGAEEGVSTLRPELAVLEAALTAVEVKEDLLLLVDCRTALTEIDKWI